jgi:hypothetical protein
VALTDSLMQDNNAPAIKRCKEELMKTPAADWVKLIKKTAETVHLTDTNSVQNAIDDFVRENGHIDKVFQTDLFASGPLRLLLREAKNKANFK